MCAGRLRARRGCHLPEATRAGCGEDVRGRLDGLFARVVLEVGGRVDSFSGANDHVGSGELDDEGASDQDGVDE